MSVDYRPDYDPADVDSDYGHTGGNITVPTFTGDTRPFRFWCQKALPLVYDDSLSYYEVLCKMADYMNNFVTDLTTVEDSMTEFGQQFVINQQFLNSMADQLGQNVADLEAYINDRMDDFMTAYTQLQTYVNNYFDNLDVQEEINTKLDEMASDGTLNNLFDPVLETWMQQKTAQIDAAIANQDAMQAAQNARISVLEGRMDTFSGLPSGSTSGNAELLDIRTNFLGETYPTAGDAVRASDMIASGFQSIGFSRLTEWDGNESDSRFDTIQIDVTAYKGGHMAVIANTYQFVNNIEQGAGIELFGSNVAGKTVDSNAHQYPFPDGVSGIPSPVFKDFKVLTTSVQDEERILIQLAIPEDFQYQYLKLGNIAPIPGEGYSYTQPAAIVYASSWSKTQVDPTLTIAGDAADAKAAGDAIDELNERLNAYYTSATEYINEWNQGWIRDDGTFGTSTINCRTGMITYSSDIVTLEVKTGYKYALFEYTTSSGGLVQKHFRGRTENYTFEPDPSHYYAIDISKIDDTTLNVSDVPVDVLSETDISITDTTLSKSKKPADAKATGDSIASVSLVANSASTKVNAVTEYATVPGYNTNDNLLDGLTLQAGYYGDNNGFVNNSNFSYLSVDVTGVTKIKINGTHHTYTTAQFDQLGVFVDSNGDLVKSIKTQYGSTPSIPYEIEIPTGATTLRLNTDYKASDYPSSLPSGLYVYPWGVVSGYYIPSSALEQSPVTLTELTDGIKKVKLIAGVVRNSGNGWEYINDSNHEPLNLSDIYVDENGKLVIEYSFTASKVLSLVATPDEDFANKYTIGGSVGLDKTLFNVCTLPQEIGGKVTISNGTADVTASTFTGFTINASTGEIRLAHPSLSYVPSKYVFNISAHCDNYTVAYGSHGYDYVSLYLKDENGTTIKDLTGLTFTLYATRSVSAVQVNANNVVSANGNFWIYGVMEIN